MRIVHLTVLNPVQHTRIFAKLARSQARLGHRVCILGQGSGRKRVAETVEIWPQGVFGRMSAKRWLAPLWLLPRAWRMRADLYTVHTPELLFTAWLLRSFRGAKIAYDVHEDYADNLRYGPHWPAGARRLLAWLFRRWERWAVRRWVDGVSYAERIYVNRLGAEHWVLLENRWAEEGRKEEETASDGKSAPEKKGAPIARPFLLYGGTLARAWGLFEAVALWEAWQAHEPMHLVVAGHTQQRSLLAQLKTRVDATGWAERFTLIGGDRYVPHSEIMTLMRQCWAGLGLYQPLPQVVGKVPTKFFEFMASGRPLIFTPQPAWLALNAQTPLGIPWQQGDSVEVLIEQLRRWPPPALPPTAYAWEPQVPALAAWLDGLAAP